MRQTLMLVGLIAVPVHLCAQQIRRPVPLEIPEGEVLRCSWSDGEQAASSSRMQRREFLVGSPETERTPEGLERGRKITIAADSLDRPVLLLEETSQDWLGGVMIMRVISADSTKSFWQQIAIDSVAMARAIAATDVEGIRPAMRILPHRLLNASERTRADSLATWLWARRCGRPRG